MPRADAPGGAQAFHRPYSETAAFLGENPTTKVSPSWPEA